MSKHEKLIDSFAIPKGLTWKMDESKEDSVVDGVNILGKAVGPFFLPGGASLNGRFYSKPLWEKAISKNAERLEYGEMLGTIGHDQPLDDQALLEGKVSHKVTKLWIDEETGAGMGEIQILGTSAGKELNAMLRGGIRLKVSSRAMGEYKGKTKDGLNMIDEDTFNLEGFDFVQRPGVPTAIPILVESQTDDNANPENTPSENTMSHELLESITREKMKLQEQLDATLVEVSKVSNEKAALQSQLESKDREIARTEEVIGDRNRKVTVLESQVADLQSQVAAFDKLGSADEVNSALESAEQMISTYKEFGTPDELTEAFDRVNQLVDDYSELGSPDEIEATFTVAEEYLELGTVEEIKAKLASLSKYESLGTVDALTEQSAVLESYKDLGTPEQIGKAFDMTQHIVEKFQNEAKAKEVEDISAKFGVKADLVESLISKHGKDEALSIIESFKSEDVADRYGAPAKTVESAPSEDAPRRRPGLGATKKIEEKAPEGVVETPASSRLSRLMESFSR